MRILLCDDHVLFCEALRAALSPQGHEVHTCFRPEDAVALAAAGGFDVVVMDLGFPDGDELGAVAAIRAIVEGPGSTAVVVLSATAETGRLLEALRAGAAAVCSKSQRLQEIVAIVQRVGSGGSAAVRGDTVARLRRTDRDDERGLAAFLTAREYEVLRRLVIGQSTHAIAAEMGVSYSTSRTHIQSVLVKLGVHSRLAASAFAVRNHLMDNELSLREPARSHGTTVTVTDSGPTGSGSRVGVRRESVSD